MYLFEFTAIFPEAHNSVDKHVYFFTLWCSMTEHYRQYAKDRLSVALEMVRSGALFTIAAAAKTYGVRKSTISDKVRRCQVWPSNRSDKCRREDTGWLPSAHVIQWLSSQPKPLLQGDKAHFVFRSETQPIQEQPAWYTIYQHNIIFISLLVLVFVVFVDSPSLGTCFNHSFAFLYCFLLPEVLIQNIVSIEIIVFICFVWDLLVSYAFMLWMQWLWLSCLHIMSPHRNMNKYISVQISLSPIIKMAKIFDVFIYLCYQYIFPKQSI